jgi:glycosyltransferase involved in cell wall biosynthesis
MSEARPRRRAVVLVGNPAAPYSRGLRIARALTDAGYQVEIAAVAGEGFAEDEMEGTVQVRRYRPRGPFAVLAPRYRGSDADPGSRRSHRGLTQRLRHGLGSIPRWLLWPHTVRGWWASLASSLEPADLYHACGSLTVKPALDARSRDARAGRRSVVVYDAIDDIAGSNALLEMPTRVRRSIALTERRWARRADARITVNEALAERLAERWTVADRPLVVPNWPVIPTSLAHGADDRIRQRLGLSATTRVVLFQGRLGPNLGIDEAAEAVLQVEDAALVLLGFGNWAERCRARDDQMRFRGHHYTLPAVHPDELVAWTASADVALVPLPPISENQRASTPNKFWEAIAAGTPVVIGPGLTEMADLVEQFGLGETAASLRPADLAAAIRIVVDVEPELAAERRRRISRIARERFDWRTASAAYLQLVRTLMSDPSPVPGSIRAPEEPTALS